MRENPNGIRTPPPRPRTPSLATRATGSTGSAIQDGTVRGIIAAALTGILAFLQIEFDLLSAAGVAALAPVVIFVAFALAGLWDRYGAVLDEDAINRAIQQSITAGVPLESIVDFLRTALRREEAGR